MNNKVLKKEYIFLDLEVKNQKEAFEFIAQKALDFNIATSANALVKGFEKRESEGTTGFEDGFAIPHARIKEVKEAAVFVLRFKEGLNWESMDGKPTTVAIALLVPDGPSGDEHLGILSDVAVKLMNEDFKKSIKNAKTVDAVLKAMANEKETAQNAVSEKPKTNNKDSLNIVAITACTTGIAHTYMAEEKLLKTGKELGYNLRVETHGSKGIGTPFTQKEIDDADLVIFATDINVDNSRFAGKKFYHTPVAKAVKNPKEVIASAIKNGKILETKVGEFTTKKSNAGQKTGVIQHILAGISYMIPVIVLGGICLAFSLGLAKIIWGPEASAKGTIISGSAADGTAVYSDPWGPLAVLEIIGGAAFTLMIPILAGFIGNSIAGRAAIAPAMVGAFIGNDASKFMPLPGMDVVQTPTGFIGALISGLLVGYFVRWVNTWRVPKSLAPAMPIFFIPLMAGIGISIIFIYVIGGPIGFVMDKVSIAIRNAYQGTVGIGVGLGLGALLGAMAGFDMGGPINKIAFVTSSVLITQGIQEPMGAVAAAIPVAPLGMGLTTVIFKKFFNEDERGLGIAALIMGCIGISEGAIPFALRDPRRAIPTNVAGSLVAGMIAGGFEVTDAAAHGGPIVAILGAVPYGLMTFYFFIAIIAGVAVTTTSYGFWMLFEAGKPGSVRETHMAYLNEIRAEKNVALSDIDAQIQDLKMAMKEDKKAKAKVKKDDHKIEKLKLEKTKIKKKYQDQVALAKKTLKENEVLESAKLKENKEKIQTLKAEVKLAEKAQIEKIHHGKNPKENKEKVALVKQETHQRIVGIEEEYRLPFVTAYRQKLKINA